MSIPDSDEHFSELARLPSPTQRSLFFPLPVTTASIYLSLLPLQFSTEHFDGEVLLT